MTRRVRSSSPFGSGVIEISRVRGFTLVVLVRSRGFVSRDRGSSRACRVMWGGYGLWVCGSLRLGKRWVWLCERARGRMACFLAFARVCVSCSADAVARCVGRRRVLTAVRCLMSSDVRSVRACCLELARCGARRAARRRRATARRDGRATRRNTAQMASPSLVTSDFRDQTETRERLDLSRTFSSGLIVDIPTCPSALSKSEEGVHSP